MTKEIKNFEYEVTISYSGDYTTKKKGKIITQFNRVTLTNSEQLLKYCNDNVCDSFLYKDNKREDINIEEVNMLCFDIDITKNMTAKQREIYVKKIVMQLKLENISFALSPSKNYGLHLRIPIKPYIKDKKIDTQDFKEGVKFTKHKIAEQIGIENDYDTKQTNIGMLIGGQYQYCDNLFAHYTTRQSLNIDDYMCSYLKAIEKDTLNVMYINDADVKFPYYTWNENKWWYENVNQKSYRKNMMRIKPQYKNGNKVNFYEFEEKRSEIKIADTYYYDTKRDVIHLPAYYFEKKKNKTNRKSIIDNGIAMITICNKEWMDFYNIYIKEVVCRGSKLIFDDFIH
jgi:hypothetical protein